MISYSSLTRHRLITSIMLLLISMLAALFILALSSGIVNASARNGGMTLPSPTVSPTKTNNSQVDSGMDPNLLNTLIGGSSAILAALIGAIGAIKAVKIAHQLQQQEKDKQDKKQEQQNENEKIEAGKTIDSLIQNYRTNLSTDLSIAHLQILDMSKPIAVTSIYVRLKLDKDIELSIEFDRGIAEAQSSYNTEKLIRIRQDKLDIREKESTDPIDAIIDYRRCIIVGDPGSGKTTLLKYLTIKSIKNDLKGLPDLPIYIELKVFANSNFNNLLDFIDAKWSEEYGFSTDVSKAYLRSQLKLGNVLVLLDGLDETFIGEKANEAEGTYGRVLNAIQHFSKTYRQSPIVVTVRKAKYQPEQSFGGFTKLEVLDFRLIDIQQFVDNWFAEDLKQAKDLNNKIRQNLHVQALAANPLLLSLITLVYEAHHNLPQHRADLYQQCVDTLITKWDVNRGVNRHRSRNLTPKYLEILLEEVAWYFHMQRQHYFPKKELLRVISEILPVMHLLEDQDTQILEEITSVYGLLFKQAEDRYGFLHLTFQEYFVSRYIARQGLPDILLARSEDPWWEGAILLSAGIPEDASPLLRKLLQKSSTASLKEDVFHTNLILAGRCLATSYIVRQISLREEIISHLFDTFTAEIYAFTRQQIVSTLIEIDEHEVNKILIKSLCDPKTDKSLKNIIIDAFGASNNLSISSDLLPLLSNVQIDKDVRLHIASMISQQRNASIIDKLLQIVLEPDIDKDVRTHIIYSLGMFEGDYVFDKLLELLTQYPNNWEIYIPVIDVMSKSGVNSSCTLLRSLLAKKDTEQEVRIHIIDALGSLNDLSGIPQLLNLLAEPLAPLKERLCIVDNLSRLGDESTVMQLQQKYQASQANSEIHQCVAITLVRLRNHSLVNDLLQLLINPNVQLAIRQSIAITLVNLADASVSQQLLKICFDTPMDTTIQKCILDAIGMLDDRSLVPILVPLTSNSNIDPEVRIHVVYTLEVLGKQLPVSELLLLLFNDKVNTQMLQLIIDKLGENGEPSLIPELLPLLSNQKIAKNVRQSLANAIGRLANDEETAQALAELLCSSDIKDDIHSALWKVSRQARVRISMIDGPAGKIPNISKW